SALRFCFRVYFFLLPLAINSFRWLSFLERIWRENGLRFPFSLIDIRPPRFLAAISFCMNALSDFVAQLLGLGLEPKDLTFTQVSLRGVVIFLITLVMVRLSSKRSLAEKTAFDAILLVILASVLSRAITGTA